MRKVSTFLLITLAAIAIPAYAARGKDQSYITYDDGGTIVKQGDDGREVDARVNFPIYPGDEVTTGQRGRTEIRLADGNIVALDRSTSVRFRSIYDSYESDSMQSVIELRYGHAAVQRTDEATELLRVDTDNASYAATDEAVYAVDVDSRRQDRLTVYDGSVEVRTPQRSTRVNTGEEARIDDQGIYDLIKAPTGVADEFERWFARRSERYSSASSRYLDRSLAYSDYDLQENGSWIFASSYGGYAWRPHVAVGWRPYFYGRWGYGPGGCLTWISYEPWGWVPYHYGRWAYEPLYGWVWLPGYTYAPAWVYWAYGPGYIGWAPAGWYDCYRPYYGWAYRPYARGGFDFGFGFYGRVRLNEVDLRPWTFVNANHIVSNRIDQAALNTDAIRQRLIRDPNATVTGTPARFTKNELKDPAAAVNNIVRRGLVGGTGRGSSGTAADMTPFFRRDPELSSAVRDRIVRSRAAEPVVATGGGATGVGAPSGIPTPGTRGTLEGRTGRDGSGTKGDYRPGEATGRVFRDPYGRSDTPSTPSTTTNRESPERSTTPRRDRQVTTPERNNNWRNQVDRTTPPKPSTTERPSVDRTAPAKPPTTERPSGDRTTPPAQTERPPQENWRSRSVERGGDRNAVPRDRSQSGDPQSYRDRGADIPRRIIDRIGGARITSGDAPRETARPRETPPPQERSAPPPSQERSSPPPRQEHSSPPPSSKSNDSGGHVHRGN